MLADGYIDFLDSTMVKRNMEMARMLGVPTRDEEMRLLRAAQNGCETSREQLCIRHTPFVIMIAKKYRHRGVEMVDLYQCGLMGLNKAIDKFDRDSKNRLISYAVWWITQAILLEVQERGATIRVPINKQMKLQHVRRLVKDQLACGEVINEGLIAKKVGISRKLASDLIVLSMPTMSLNFSLKNNGMDDGGEVQDTLAGESYDEVGDKSEFAWAMRIIERTPRLSDREKMVLRERFLKGRTLEDIAGDLGVSRERVRQIEWLATRRARAVFAAADAKQGIKRSDRLTMLSMGG